MKRLCNMLAIAALGTAGVFCLAHAENAGAQAFVSKASIANRFEIDSSRLAVDKAQRNEVKFFAQKMVDDHSRTGDALNTILESSESEAKPADALDGKHQKLLDKLSSTPNNRFDREYIAAQTHAHKEAVSLFADYAQNGTDPRLKQFAADTLPTLQEHLRHVQKLTPQP